VPGPGQDSMFRACTADYLQTLGVQLVEGRLLDDRDGVDAPKVVVINETFARTQWPGESALGRRVSYGAADAPWRTVVGVVKDVRERGYRLEMKPGTYAPYAQGLSAWFPENLIVRTSGDPLALAAAVRRVIAGVDPEQPVAAVRTMQEILDLDIADRSQQATLVGVFAALALLLAALGLYGVLSYGVTQRRREIGLRMALGASAPTVVLTIVGRGLSLAAIGLALGLAIAWAAARAIAALLYGVAAADGWTFGGVMALLGLVALVACILPALRAARVQPMEVLRQE
jgi:putative ABC transport system permease protein